MDVQLLKLLLALSEVIGPNMKICISGSVVDTAAAEMVRKSMTTTFQCNNAWVWELYAAVSRAKGLADQAIQDDQPDFACELLGIAAGHIVGFTRRVNPSVGDRSLYYATCLLACDSLLTKAHLHMMGAQFEDAGDRIADVQEILSSPSFDEMGRPATLARCAHHLAVLLVFYRRRVQARDRRFLDAAGTVAEFIMTLSAGKGVDAWALHDVDVLSTYKNMQNRIEVADIPFESSSFRWLSVGTT